MKIIGCLTATEILNANGRVINNPDGTISVFTISPITGLLAPVHLTKPCCEKLGIAGSFFDVNSQECRWSPSGTNGCDYSSAFNLVLNPKGNDGAIFSISPEETCTLGVEFDYLFDFTCASLANLIIHRPISGTCRTSVDVFENIGASMTIDIVDTVLGSTVLTKVYEEQFFSKIGAGNLYTYLKGKSADTGFYVCGTTGLTDTACSPVNLYNLNTGAIDNSKTSCTIFDNQVLDILFQQSGLPSSGLTEFKQAINENAFASNWLHFTTLINDPVIISAITNEKIKLTVKLSGSCIDGCLLLDNIKLNKNCTKVLRNDIFLSKSPSFELDRIRDNKKAWIANTETTHREFNITKPDGTSPIRYTDYYLDDERQVINTKELDLDINIASAVETDVWCYISDNSCILTGLSGCIVYTSSTTSEIIISSGSTSGYTTSSIACCNPTYEPIVITSTVGNSYTCPSGYIATSGNMSCQEILTTAATFNGSGSTIVHGTIDVNYSKFGAYFYPSIQTSGALPVYYNLTANLKNQTGGTITALAINNVNSFWTSTGAKLGGRLNAAGLSASTTQYLGFSECINSVSGGTYYIGMAADNYCRFKLNGVLMADFSAATTFNFNFWSVFPVVLNAGINIIEMEGKNESSETAFAAEIYEPISFATLTGATSTGSTQANVIFSTLDRVGTFFDLGTTIGYSCPSGYVLDRCATTPTCSIISNTGIIYSSINITTTATTGCCSGSCGDDGAISINNLLTQQLSGVTTIEDFQYYLTSELIDAKDRKVISGYPTLRSLYDRYMNSTDFCATNSSKFDYVTMDKFAGLIGNYWVDIIEQVVPATTLWGSTRIYTNTIFDKQKFRYRGYSTFFGDNAFVDVNVLSPASGTSTSASATTIVIQGSSTGTTMFFNQGDEHNYSNMYLVQMNSGSEFLGSVNIVGPSGGNNVINETF